MPGEAFSEMDKEGGRVGSGALGSGQGGVARCAGRQGSSPVSPGCC